MPEQAAGARLDAEDLHIRIFAAKPVELPLRSWNSANEQDPFWRLYMNNRAGDDIGSGGWRICTGGRAAVSGAGWGALQVKWDFLVLEVIIAPRGETMTSKGYTIRNLRKS